MHKLNKFLKIDLALTAAQHGTSAVTGAFYKMGQFRRALFVLIAGALAKDTTSKLQIVQAPGADGSGAKNIDNATCTITANTKVNSLTITAAAVEVADTITVNGITFKGASAEGLNKREFKADKIAETGNAATATSIAACINDAVYGVPGVTASASAAVVTLTVDEPGKTVITATSSSATTLAVATISAIAFVEVEATHLDEANGFTHVAAEVTNSVAAISSVTLLRGNARYTPDQVVAASKDDVSA